MKKLTKEVLSKHLEKIDKLQREADRLLHTGNAFVRWWNFRKAMKLHLEADRELEKLNHPQDYWIVWW